MKKLRIWIIILIIAVILFIGIKIGHKTASIITVPAQTASTVSQLQQTIKAIEEIEEKFDLKEIIITDFSKKSELITSEIILSENITWNESWGNLDMFKKSQIITFTGKGIYTIDLGTLTDEDIIIENSDNILITLSLNKPTVKSIEILNDKTSYIYEKGIFRFGNIDMSIQQSQIIEQTVKEQMKEKMYTEQLYNVSLDTAEESIRDLFEGILSKINQTNYMVKIEWKN